MSLSPSHKHTQLPSSLAIALLSAQFTSLTKLSVLFASAHTSHNIQVCCLLSQNQVRCTLDSSTPLLTLDQWLPGTHLPLVLSCLLVRWHDSCGHKCVESISQISAHYTQTPSHCLRTHNASTLTHTTHTITQSHLKNASAAAPTAFSIALPALGPTLPVRSSEQSRLCGYRQADMILQ